MLSERFARLLSAWLESLPSEGWTGTPTDLGDAPDAFNRDGKFYAWVPLRRTVPEMELHAATIAAAGWKWNVKRTRRERLIQFTPTAAVAEVPAK